MNLDELSDYQREVIHREEEERRKWARDSAKPDAWLYRMLNERVEVYIVGTDGDGETGSIIEANSLGLVIEPEWAAYTSAPERRIFYPWSAVQAIRYQEPPRV